MPNAKHFGTPGASSSSFLGRIPPWILAFLLTGCPLDPLAVQVGAGGGVTTTLTSTVGCGMSNECDDNNPCTVDTCENGVCSYAPADEGTPCPDSSECNGDETCNAEGVCAAGKPKIVDDGDMCTLDLCDPESGEVSHPPSPACGVWEATASANAPSARTKHSAVWTGTEMIVWGGEVDIAVEPAGVTATGGRYDPAAKTWKAMSTTGAPAPRHSHVAIWTGSKMLVWGGFGDTMMEPGGGIYDPATDSWAAITTTGAPQPRVGHAATWTGSEMIMWGGLNQVALGTGGIYNPATDTWTATPNGPGPRFGHGLTWTGTTTVLWGGNDYFDWHQDGRFFDVASGWGGETSLTGVPDRREGHSQLWTGTDIVVWGGFDGGTQLQTGGVFDPAAPNGGTWSPITTDGAPAGRRRHVGVWAGSQMMVWGGCGDESCVSPKPPFDDGGFWIPGANGGAWKPIESGKVTTARVDATGVWTGTHVVIWGGKAGLTGKLLDTGAQSVP